MDLDTSIEWIDTSETDITNCIENIEFEEENSFEETITPSFGKINKNEALISLKILQKYIEKIGLQRVIEENLDIGVISPYRAQIQYLKKLIKQTPFFKPIKKQISINTVDGFQGQERDIIIISMVRSNERGEIGFLRDLRRMNVAITRAKMKLIIIGNKVTLTTNSFYKELFFYIQNLKEFNL